MPIDAFLNSVTSEQRVMNTQLGKSQDQAQSSGGFRIQKKRPMTTRKDAPTLFSKNYKSSQGLGRMNQSGGFQFNKKANQREKSGETSEDQNLRFNQTSP